jgi:hypothetical protein
MKEFSTALLREKFVIRDLAYGHHEDERSTLIALSNRMVVELRDNSGDLSETFIVRAQNMHSTIRISARIIQAYKQGGPLLPRATAFDWEGAWGSIVNDYEYAYNPDRWVAIYNDGKCIYQQNEHHSFLDVVEKCDIDNELDYDFAIPRAEELFAKAGKDVKILHDANVALSTEFRDNQGRCGVISRGSNQTTTFTFSVRPERASQDVNVAQAISCSAAFLEGIQLAFLVGFNTEKIRLGIIERFSKEEKQTREAGERLARLRHEISSLEDTFEVRYRPEKPSFTMFLNQAETLAQKTLVAPSPKPIDAQPLDLSPQNSDTEAETEAEDTDAQDEKAADSSLE